MTNSLIPETAPFNEEQRQWLNGFFSGLMGLRSDQGLQVGSNGNPQAGDFLRLMSGLSASHGDNSLSGPQAANGQRVESNGPETEEDFPWHDSSLPIVERMELAKDKPVARRLMAAMAQLNCGSCGYLCQSYAEAIATGQEKNLSLCTPGGTETKKAIKLLLKDVGAVERVSDGAKPESINHQDHAVAGQNGSVIGGGVKSGPVGFDRKNPFTARLVESKCLNKPGSQKDTRHVVIDLAGSGLRYEVGDALGIYPENCRDLCGEIVTRLGADPATRVSTPSGSHKPLIDALREDFCLRDATDELLELLANRIDDSATGRTIAEMIDRGVPAGFDVLDAIDLASMARVTATEIVETLRPISPRLYSIASSMKRVGAEVHLTVGKVVYEREGRVRKGVASTLLSDRLGPGETVRVFVHPNHGGFTVPPNDDAPVIMVGPGTGIAPFMAFLQEREARKAGGKNWLLFGDQHRATDFLYEDELEGYLRTGLLTRLDTAFSRDGVAKVYVQDRMREHSAALWEWLSGGGHFYVCGDASRMAADVQGTLLDIIRDHGAMDDAGAKKYLKRLADEKRYVRDVY
jgi:sulfite reductase (NADPH) flavoprotein alpha-component